MVHQDEATHSTAPLTTIAAEPRQHTAHRGEWYSSSSTPNLKNHLRNQADTSFNNP